MLFLNISSDYVHLLDDQDEQFLPRNTIETNLWPAILEYTKTHPVETIFLLNGPGGFTNLRVGALLLNMMNELLLHDTGTFIPLASITKIDFYTYAYTQGRLPRYGIIYIGQKHNVRKFDAETKSYEQISLEDITYSDDIFFDRVRDPYWENDEQMVSFSMSNNSLFLNYRGDSHKIELMDLHLPMTMSIEPQYMIEPTMN